MAFAMACCRSTQVHVKSGDFYRAKAAETYEYFMKGKGQQQFRETDENSWQRQNSAIKILLPLLLSFSWLFSVLSQHYKDDIHI